MSEYSKINRVLMNVYKVTFIKYDNYYTTSVHNNFGDTLELGTEPFLVLEKDLELYRQFGNGYRSIELIGKMQVIVEE